MDKAREWSHVDPSVSKIKSWQNPLTGDTEEVLRRWTLFSRAHLASMFLSLYNNDFSVAMEKSVIRKVWSFSVPSERYVREVLKSFSWLSTSKQYKGTYFGCGKCVE